jgi:capsular polysaccharide biosynthesis protein
MSQLFRPSVAADPERNDDTQFTPSSSEVRALPAAPNAEQAFFQLDIRRSLELHWRLARVVALGFVALAVAYFLAQVFVLKSWPAYVAESIVYVQPTPAKVLPNQGGSPRWPFDSNTYETYIQQQMMNVSRQDVLVAALHKLKGFQHSGESDQAAALRLVRLLEVTRVGAAYQFSISARAGNPAMAAQIANAVTAAYIESASRDERTGDAQRLQMLNEERDRIQTALTADRTEQDALNKQLGVASVSSAVPDHYDEDITQIRTELVKARTDHDEAESKFASLGAGHGASSSAIDAAADEMIANDAGLVSMKQALNTRRATLISQMANLTPLNPQYKQDEAELAKINGTLDAMMKDLRARAAARIQLQLRTDLERTGGVEAQLNGQLRQLVGAATSATPKMQRSGDLAADITRLQARYASVDEQLHNLMLEDSAPAAAYQVTLAAPPLGRTKSGVLRNVLMIAFAGLFFGVLAAIGAHKLDPKVYISSDVEQVLGFAPLAQLPNFREVSEGAAEEYILRLTSAIEHARKQGNLKNCIFTGTGSGAGVSTLVNRVGEMLEAMGRPTVLVDATGATAPRAVESTPGLVPVERVSRPTALLQQMAAGTETEEGRLVLTDTAPLAVSAETEYLARFVDCAIVVIESGVTTRAQLREAAATLQRLNVGAVGFVLNRVGLAKADPAFRASVEAVEKHLKAQGNSAARRTERHGSFAPEQLAGRDALPKAVTARALFEPEVAAAAAAVARLSSPPVLKAAAAPAVCLPSSMVFAPTAEAAKRFSLPLASASITEMDEAVASRALAEPVVVDPVVAEPVVADPVLADVAAAALPATASAPVDEAEKSETSPEIAGPAVAVVPQEPSAPFAEAAMHFSAPVTTEPEVPFSPPVAAASTPPPAVEEETSVALASAASAVDEPEPTREPEAAREPEPVQPVTPPASDLPWWLSDAPRSAEPVRPPVLWQPAKVWTPRPASADAAAMPVAANVNPEPRQTWVNTGKLLERVPSQHEASRVEAPFMAVAQEAQKSDSEEAPADRTSRLGGLRNLLFVLGVKDAPGGEEQAQQYAAGESNFETRNTRTIPENRAGGVGGASPRLVTAPPEFLPPKPVVIEFDKADARVGESSTRQDRRAAADGIEILPSKRGQYKKI